MGEKQHFIPQFYLRGFTDPATPPGHEPYVWVADLKARIVRKKSPKSIAAQTNLYEWQSLPASAPRAEDLFQHFEGKTAPLLHTLEVGRPPQTPEERFVLATHLALQLARTPAFRQAVIRGAESASQRMAERAFATAEPLVRLREELGLSIREALQRYRVRPDLTKDQELAFALKAALEGVAPLLFAATWTILRAPADAYFLTTEQPVSLLTMDAAPRPFEGADGTLNAELQVGFVVSPTATLLVHQLKAEMPTLDLTSGQVETCNHGMLRAAPRWAFASNQDLAQWACNDDTSKPPRERIPIVGCVD